MNKTFSTMSILSVEYLIAMLHTYHFVLAFSPLIPDLFNRYVYVIYARTALKGIDTIFPLKETHNDFNDVILYDQWANVSTDKYNLITKRYDLHTPCFFSLSSLWLQRIKCHIV